MSIQRRTRLDEEVNVGGYDWPLITPVREIISKFRLNKQIDFFCRKSWIANDPLVILLCRQMYFNTECVCVFLYMCSCSRRLCARLSLGSRSTAWCPSVYSTNFWGEGPQQLLTGCDLDEAHRSPLSWDDLTPDNMCIRHLGFVLLIWCPGELHGKNIESFHRQTSELL